MPRNGSASALPHLEQHEQQDYLAASMHVMLSLPRAARSRVSLDLFGEAHDSIRRASKISSHAVPGQNEDGIEMANILVNIEKGIEVAAADVLKWLGKAQTAVSAAPAVVAALATLVTQLEKPIMEVSGVASNPLNIALDLQTATDLKAVWPDIKAFLVTLGVKF